jgi:hypothetical protein
MDQFVIKNGVSSQPAENQSKSKNKLLDHFLNTSKSTAHTSAEVHSAKNVWEQRENLLNAVDIACAWSEVSAKQKNFVGWKTSSTGGKVYTTFRNGHRVAAEGQEGFKLAYGDEKNGKSKRKVTEIVDDSESTFTMRKVGKTKATTVSKK